MFNSGVSMFRCVAVGIASENKKRTSHELMISSHEKLPFMDGEAVHKVDNMEYEAQRAHHSGPLGGNAFVSTDLVATWLPDTNRITPPDVERGEKVEIWQMASSDKYYWRSMGMDDHLRRLETVVIGIAATPEMNQDGRLPENMYFLEVSSHNKSITLSTSQKNGEYCKYNLQFDLANGKVVLEDSLGQSGLFDSKNINIRFQNQLGSFFEMNKQSFNASLPKNVNIKATENIDMAAKKITLNGGGSVLTIEASGTTLKTPKFTGGS